MNSGSPHDINDTHDITHHIAPGRQRAPFYRYIRINLPRATRVLLLGVVAAAIACLSATAASGHDIFLASGLALRVIIALWVVVLLVGLIPTLSPWTFGTVPAAATVLLWIAGLFAHAPFVGNGASVPLAATWNLMLALALAYLALWWALRVRMIVASPDDQHFDD